MENFHLFLEKYAELAVKIGVNLQKGQVLVINAPIQSVSFVRAVAQKAYEAGAKNVHVEWSDEQVTRTKFEMAPFEAFQEFPHWKAQGYVEMAENGAAFLSISATNPDLLQGIEAERIATANKTQALAMKDFSQYTRSGRVSWAIVSVPTKEWAHKIFPQEDEQTSMALLWEHIFRVTRVTEDNPIAAWQEHLARIRTRLEYLNTTKFKKLRYQTPGTDLTIELHEKHLWVGGGIVNQKGTYFVPNLPTEEVFTCPRKDGVNGVVRSTKPLNYGGNLIDGFSLTFKDGKIVDFAAEQGYETLKKLIETDDGAARIGEIALVPHDSPISQSNLIFYNTLFDENASCHLALGSAYPLCIEGGTQMSKEELSQHGVNESIVHVDFMIGSAELDIDGETQEGQVVPLFRNGNWVI